MGLAGGEEEEGILEKKTDRLTTKGKPKMRSDVPFVPTALTCCAYVQLAGACIASVGGCAVFIEENAQACIFFVLEPST